MLPLSNPPLDAVLLLLVPFVTPAVVEAQQEWTVKCVGCTISLESVVTLGSEEGEGFVGDFNVVQRSGRHFLVRSYGEPEVVRVFDLAGRYIRQFGRSGEGPGEFRGGGGMRVGVGDSVFVLDSRLQRISVFGHDFGFVRSWRVPFFLSDEGMVLLSDGRVLVTGNPSSREMVGIPHHVMDRNGVLSNSFGDPMGPYSPGGSRFVRAVALGPAETVWVAHHEEYRLTRWSLSGERELVLSPIRRWFEDSRTGTVKREPDGKLPPRSGLLDVCEDSDGLLWVLGRAADPNWREAYGPDGRRRDLQGYYSSMIEVFDVATGSLITSARIPDVMIQGFMDSQHVYGTTFDGAYPRAAVWKASLRRTPHPAGPVFSYHPDGR